MGAASGRLGRTRRHGWGAGLLGVLVMLVVGALPAAADRDHGQGQGQGDQHGRGPDHGAPPAQAAPAAPPGRSDHGDRRHGPKAEAQHGPPPSAPAAPADGAPDTGRQHGGGHQAEQPAHGNPHGEAGPAPASSHRGEHAAKHAGTHREPAATRGAPTQAVAIAAIPSTSSDVRTTAAPAATNLKGSDPFKKARARTALSAGALRRAAAREQRRRRAAARRHRAVVQRRRAAIRHRQAARPRTTPAPVRPVVVAAPYRPIATAAATTAPTADAGAPRTAAPRHHHGGVLHVFPVIFSALSASVAFVPLAVWIALGALGLLALALALLAFARDRRARALARERTALVADLAALEEAVLPTLPEALGGLALSVTSAPAAAPISGGDFHDAFPLSGDRVAVLVGDVAGTGRQALADAQLVRHAVRAYLEAGLDPRAAIAMTGAVVDDREEPLFASVLVAVHDRRDGSLTFASAGHEPPIIVGEHGASLPPVSGWSPPLGAGLETGRRQTSMPLPEGTAVCLLTDGVTEARTHGERLGASRVIQWLAALGPGAMASDVVSRVRAEADAIEEDVTVCMLRALTPAGPHVPRIEEAIVEGGDPTYLIRFLRDCGLPLADAEEAGAALAATPDGTRMVASVEIRGGRAVVELAPLGHATTTELTYG